MTYIILPKNVFFALIAIISVLLAANCVGIFFEYYLGHDYVYSRVPLFNFDTERNISTLFSALLLALISALLFLITASHKSKGRPWLLWVGLASIFIFLSVDEIVSLHERLIEPVRDGLGTSGVFYYAWVIPYSLGLIFLLSVYARFLIRLGRFYSLLFTSAGAVFCAGAIGLELVGGFYADRGAAGTLAYALITTLEELLEMVGASIFLYALLRYLHTEFDSPVFQISGPNARLSK